MTQIPVVAEEATEPVGQSSLRRSLSDTFSPETPKRIEITTTNFVTVKDVSS